MPQVTEKAFRSFLEQKFGNPDCPANTTERDTEYWYEVWRQDGVDIAWITYHSDHPIEHYIPDYWI